MRDRIVITGAAGFIGSALAARLTSEGAQVHALVRPDAAIGRLVPGVMIHPVDLADPVALADVFAAAMPTTIYHLATYTGRGPAGDLGVAGRVIEDGVKTLTSLLMAAARLPQAPRSFVRTGTLAEYGDGPMPSREDQREKPKSAYAATMVASAQLVAALQPQLSFPVRSARLGLTYGPSQSTAFLIPWLIERCLAGEQSFVRSPEQRRDLIFVDDVVDGLIALARTDNRDAALVNLSTGVAPTMRQAALLVAQCCGANPRLLTFGEGSDNTAPRVVCGAPTRANALLGWRAGWSLEAGLRRTICTMRHERAAA